MKEPFAKEIEQLWNHIVAVTAVPASFLDPAGAPLSGVAAQYWKEHAIKIRERCSTLKAMAMRLMTDRQLRKMKKRSFWKQRGRR